MYLSASCFDVCLSRNLCPAYLPDCLCTNDYRSGAAYQSHPYHDPGLDWNLNGTSHRCIIKLHWGNPSNCWAYYGFSRVPQKWYHVISVTSGRFAHSQSGRLRCQESRKATLCRIWVASLLPSFWQIKPSEIKDKGVHCLGPLWYVTSHWLNQTLSISTFSMD